jgi:hypothetical protein
MSSFHMCPLSPEDLNGDQFMTTKDESLTLPDSSKRLKIDMEYEQESSPPRPSPFQRRTLFPSLNYQYGTTRVPHDRYSILLRKIFQWRNPRYTARYWNQ